MNGWLKTGLAGSVVTGLCCFTPLLVWLLPAVGLGALVAGLDVVLIPLLVIFLAVLAIGLWKQRSA